MAPGQAPDSGAADISARGLRAFFRLDSDGPTVRDGRAYFGSAAAPDPAQACNGGAASACAAVQSADGAAGTQPGSARPGVAGSENGGGSDLGAGHGNMAPNAGAAGASGDVSGSGSRDSLQGGAPQAAAQTPAAARECSNGGAGGDADVELPIVTPFSNRLQDVLQRVAAAPVRPAWRVGDWLKHRTNAMHQAGQENAASGKSQAELHGAQCLVVSSALSWVARPRMCMCPLLISHITKGLSGACRVLYIWMEVRCARYLQGVA